MSSSSSDIESYPITLRFLLSDDCVETTSDVLQYWKVFSNYCSMQSERVNEFCLPSEITSLAMLNRLLDFSRQHHEVKVTHIRAPLYMPKNLTAEPYNVPQWAFAFVTSLTMGDLFELF